MTTCGICILPFNKTARKVVTCNHCNYESCRECCKQYLLHTVNNAHCMNCKVPWNTEFISSQFTKKFFNDDFSRHRGEVLFEREKALMPETQEQIRVMHLEKEIACLQRVVDMYKDIKNDTEAERYRELVATLTNEHPDAGASTSSKNKKENRPRAVCGCIKSGCNGFIMDNTWKCGICSTKACNECLKEKAEGHVCAEEDKATRKLLLHNTKPCPNCGVMITRTEGCNQMWCVMCHTTFNWSNGEIIRASNIHNPHYIQWVNRNPQARQDAIAPPGCHEIADGNLVPLQNLIAKMKNRYVHQRGVRDKLVSVCGITHHINEYVRTECRDREIEELNDARMAFLLGRLTEAEYKRELVKIERSKELRVSEWHIAELFMVTASDIIASVYNMNPANILDISKQIDELVKYCNDEFKRVAKLYNKPRYYLIDCERSYMIRTY